MSTSTSQDLRCPRCAAHVRAGSDWCTLCYTDLRPVPAAPVVQEPVEAPASPAPPPAPEPVATAPSAPAPAAPPVRRGKHARRAPDAEQAQAETDALAAQLLAQLAVEESGSPLGALTGLTESTGKKAALMVGGAVAVIVVLIALMALLGALV